MKFVAAFFAIVSKSVLGFFSYLLMREGDRLKNNFTELKNNFTEQNFTV